MIMLPGRDRMKAASLPVGGMTWLDWGRFNPIKGLNQIVGHTILSEPSVRYLDKTGKFQTGDLSKWPQIRKQAGRFQSINWCLDTNNAHYGEIHQGQLSIHPLPALPATSRLV